MTYRIVQWTTGNVGKRSVRAVALNPELDLVGCYAWSDDKIGRDVGELCGIETLGVTATNDVEALLALKPDAVFQWADRGDQLFEVLDRVGLPTIGVKNTGHESDIDRWMQMSGAVAGRSDRASSLIAWMQSENARFEKLTANVPQAQRPKVLMLTEYSKAITANGPTSYVAPMVRRAGGRTPAALSI